MNKKMSDLEVMVVLFLKDEMIEKGIIPENVKWDELTSEQEENVKKYVKDKLEEMNNGRRE